jgi:hypothetical protein
MKTILALCVLLCGCATPDYSGLSFEQKMMLLDRSRLYFPPVQYHPMQIQAPITCYTFGNVTNCQ